MLLLIYCHTSRLMTEVNLKSPASALTPVESSVAAGAGYVGRENVGKEKRDSGSRQQKRGDSSKGAREESRGASISSSTRIQPSLSHNPQHSSDAVDITPQAIIKKIKTEIKEEVKEEKEEEEMDMAFVVDVCRETIGRGVVGMGEVKDRLLLRQLEADPRGNKEGHRAVSRGGLSEAVLEHGLQLCGAVEVGKLSGKRLFALPLDNKVRVLCYQMQLSSQIQLSSQLA